LNTQTHQSENTIKHQFNAHTPSFDAHAINETIRRALASAGLDTTTGPMRDVTDTIRRALAGGRGAEARSPVDGASVIDVVARVVPAGDNGSSVADHTPPETQTQPQPQPQTTPQSGRFEAHEFSSDAGSRAYKVYVPALKPAEPRAMIVMLHGCTQSADDFAAGTQMNRLADEHGFVVVYPEQAAHANTSKCWNWFQPRDQQRGTGEPSLIAGIVRELAQRHGVDPGRIFVAGLSAGAAMAVVLGETYPELFSGVGAHSGLPYGSAHDIPSAMAAMKGGRSGLPGLKSARVEDANPRKKPLHAVPTIVFHGDRDHTVQQTNAVHIVVQALEAHGCDLGSATRVSGVASGGRRFSRDVHADAAGQIRIESWTVHGAGHAWSGGHASGSYTDGTGPDASAEMVRFFLALSRGGVAGSGR
jgi:poly(hydroxyalkanoate) depolymerase family esterase